MTDAFQEALDELRDRGYGVLIAHPERSADAPLRRSASLARAALGQVNALSLTGGHGDEALQSARRMVAQGLLGVVGSDAHGPTRPPALTAAREALIALGVPDARARALHRLSPGAF